MQAVKEFGGDAPKMSVREFWLTSGPVLAAILLLAVVIIGWKRPFAEGIKNISGRFWVSLLQKGRAVTGKEE